MKIIKVSVKSIVRLILPYILVALLPTISLMAFWSYIVNQHTQSVIEDKNRSIRTAVDRVDEKMRFVTELADLVSANNDVYQYAVNNHTESEFFPLDYEQIEDLLFGICQRDEISEAFIYDGHSNRLISSNMILSDANIFFEYSYCSEKYTAEEMLHNLKEAGYGASFSKAGNFSVRNKSLNIIEYRRSVPLQYYGDQRSQLVICLDTNQLFKELFDVLGENSSFEVFSNDVELFNNTGTTLNTKNTNLTDSLTDFKIDGKKYFGTEHQLKNAQWGVKLCYSESDLVDKSWSSEKYLLLLLILPIIIGIVLCILFTFQNYRNILETISLMRSTDENEKLEENDYIDYRLVRRYADRMAQKNVVYRTQIAQIQTYQRDSTLEHLLTNTYRSEKEKNEILFKTALLLPGESYTVICIQFDDINAETYIINDMGFKEYIINILRSNIGSPFEIVDLYSSELVCVLSHASKMDAQSVIDTVISVLSVQINYQYGIDLKIGVGNNFDSLADMSTSYSQAKEVIKYNKSVGDFLHLYSQLGTLNQIIYYPAQTNDKIINYIIVGQTENAKAVINDIYEENFRKNAQMPAPNAIEKIKYNIFRAVSTVAEKQNIQITEDYIEEDNIQKYFTRVIEVVDKIENEISTRKNDEHNTLVVSIREYIEENYCNSGMTVKQIANYFHFHENYISNFYKENCGENLSTTIEQLRIKKAMELLLDNNVKISDIAAKVGYYSDSTFRRAFKRITGVSPVDYRSIHTI